MSQFPEHYDGSEYFRAQVRVAVKDEEWVEEVPNRGTLYVRPGSPDTVEVNRDVNGVVRPINLTRQGTIDVNNERNPINLRYVLGRTRNYNNLGFT